jgi:hypothetical protein
MATVSNIGSQSAAGSGYYDTSYHSITLYRNGTTQLWTHEISLGDGENFSYAPEHYTPAGTESVNSGSNIKAAVYCYSGWGGETTFAYSGSFPSAATLNNTAWHVSWSGSNETSGNETASTNLTSVTDIAYTASGGGGNVKKINIGDTWKDITAAKINIGDTWKTVSAAKINIGDTWKTLF